MLKWILVTMLIASGAQAYIDYTLDLCPEPEMQCDRVAMVSEQHPAIGGIATVTVDFDEHNGVPEGVVGGVTFSVLYDSSHGTFVDAGTWGMDPGSPVACKAELASFVKPLDCPDCDTWLACTREDRFGDVVEIVDAGEIWLEFLYASPTGQPLVIHPRHFKVLGREGEELMQGNAHSSVAVVPEPGLLLGIVPGLLVLGWIGRKK